MEEKEIDYLLTLGNLCTTVVVAIAASVYFDYQQMGHIMKPISFWGAVSIATGMGSISCYLFTTANQLIQKGKK